MTTSDPKKGTSYQSADSAGTAAPAGEAAPVSLSLDQEILVRAFAKSFTDAMRDARAATLAADIDKAAIDAAREYFGIKNALRTFFEKQP